MSITSQNADYTDKIQDIEWIRPCIDGSRAIKEKTITYLPQFIPEDKTRYKIYLETAIYTNYTGFTHGGFLGMIYRINPTVKLPESIEYLEKNANGCGLGLIQVSKGLSSETLAVGNVGIHVTYPKTDRKERKGKDDKKYFATLSTYKIESRDNIKETTINGVKKLSMVKLKELKDIPIDDFSSKTQIIYRVLRLDSAGKYYVTLYDEKEEVLEKTYPKDYTGSFFDYIPFFPIGAEKNDIKIDKPPLLDLSHINIGHYRNSADYEENNHMHGQGTLLLWSNMTYDTFKKANPNGISVGARSGHFLGENGGGEILQLNESQALDTAMEKKKSDMVSLGAKFIDDTGGVKTIEATRIDASQRTSGLGTLVDNVEQGINNALMAVQQFMSATPTDDYTFEMNKTFYDKSFTAQEAAALIMLQDNEVIAKSDVRKGIRGTKFLKETRTDEDINNEINESN